MADDVKDPDDQDGPEKNKNPFSDDGDEETAEFSHKSRAADDLDEEGEHEDLAVEQMVRRAQEVCFNIIRHFPLSTTPKVYASYQDEVILLKIEGDGSGLLIGKKGQTLDALQYLVNKIANKNAVQRRRVEVDTEGYRQRRRGQLTNMARKAAEESRESGCEIALEPMTASERRIVHMALRDHPDVVTESEGYEEDRRVIIKPRK